jgi:eukaryotic-like serine/threonine-protein kinase
MGEQLAQLRTVLADRYEIERAIGHGGMATVYLARDIRSGRHVAVKVLNEDLTYALGIKRFQREIELVSHFDHPNILPILDSGEVHDQLYYVMPFVVGETLRDRIEREQMLSLTDAVEITTQIANALDYAHNKDVVHRDIKPENILLEGGHALVADFGIARTMGAIADAALTQTGVTVGTPQYMSPEQAHAERNLDGRSDIYSLGCVLYEMLAGSPPFTGRTAQAIIARQSMDEVPSLAVVRGTVPVDLEDALLRALAKEPADRYRSAREFSDALLACQLSGGRTLGTAERRRRSRRRGQHRYRLPAIAAGAVALVAMSVLAARGWANRRGVSDGAVAFDPRNVAVLYFDNPGGSLRHVADGLTEALIDRLNGVPTLNVVSRNGVEQFRQTTVSADSIAEALKAGTIVQGHVDSSAGKVVITVAMTSNGATERGNVELPAAAILGTRDSVADEVERMLRKHIGGEWRLRGQRRTTRNAEAWILLQRAEKLRKDARALNLAKDPVGAHVLLTDADSLLERAQLLDDDWIEVAISRGEVADQMSRLPSQQQRAASWIASGLEHAQRARAMDNRDARALQLRGILRQRAHELRIDPNPSAMAALLAGAEADLKGAVELDPTLARAWNALSTVHSTKLELLDAKLAAQRAYEADIYLDEASSIVFQLFNTSLNLELFREADKWCNEGARRFPDDPRFIRGRIWLLGAQAVEGSATPQDVARAWLLVEELRKRTPEARWEKAGRAARMWTAAVIARAGMRDSADHVLTNARGPSDIDTDGELLVVEAFVRQLMGEKDAALVLIKRYLSEHPDHRAGLAASRSWVWRDFHKDPRFEELVGAKR